MTFVPEQDLSQETLAGIFNDCVTQYRAAFPSMKNMLVTSATKALYIPPDIAEHLSQNVNKLKNVIHRRAEKMRQLTAAGAVLEATINGIQALHISFRMNKLRGIAVAARFPLILNLIYVLNHEVGHRAAPEGRVMAYGPAMAESTADGFALMRHLQLFGERADILKYLPFHRAGVTILQDAPFHYTSTAMFYIAKLYREDPEFIKNLSVQETGQLAGSIARDYKLPDATLKKINEAYKPAQECYAETKKVSRKDWKKIITAMVQVMQEHKDDHDIYRTGRLYLESPATQERIAKIVKQDPSFGKIFAFMEAHEKESGFILDPAAALDAQKKLQAKIPPLSLSHLKR